MISSKEWSQLDLAGRWAVGAVGRRLMELICSQWGGERQTAQTEEQQKDPPTQMQEAEQIKLMRQHSRKTREDGRKASGQICWIYDDLRHPGSHA